MKIRTTTSRQTEDGIQWATTQVHAFADELELTLDGEPEWEQSDPLNFKMAVEIGGQRKVLKLWRPHIDDSQGGNNPPTIEVQQKLQNQIRNFLLSFIPPKRRIGFSG